MGSSGCGSVREATAPEVRPTAVVSTTVLANCFSLNRQNKIPFYDENSLAAFAEAVFDRDSSMSLHSTDLE